MRLLSIVFVYCFLFGAAFAIPNTDDIKKLLGYLRHKLICGSDNLPSVNPLHIEQLNISGLVLEDLYGHGIANFDIVKVVMIPLGITLKWPNPISIQTNYSGSLELFDMMKLYGNGKISVRLDSLELTMQLFYNELEGMLNFYEVKMPLLNFADSSVVSITGLFYDDAKSRMISEELKETLAMIVRDKEIRTWLVGLLNPTLTDLLNKELSMSFDDMINGNFGDPPPPCVSIF